MAPLTQKRLWLFGLIIFLVPLGAFTKYYDGLAAHWVNNHFGDILYEIFWCLVGALCFSQTSSTKIITIVFITTCSLEILQLWQPTFLTTIRSTFIGHAIIGSSFDLWDFPYYALGCLIALIWLNRINKIQEAPDRRTKQHPNHP